jgi:hypothetical protein
MRYDDQLISDGWAVTLLRWSSVLKKKNGAKGRDQRESLSSKIILLEKCLTIESIQR